MSEAALDLTLDQRWESNGSIDRSVRRSFTPLYPSVGLEWDADPDDSVIDKLVHAWVRKAHRHCRVRRLETKLWVADVAGIEGAWAEGSTRETALAALPSVLEEWVRLKVADGDRDIPRMDGVRLVSDA